MSGFQSATLIVYGFHRALKKTEDTLQQIASLKILSRILHSSELMTKLQQCNVDLSNAMELFNVRSPCSFIYEFLIVHFAAEIGY